jgi:predicted 3-demethylubiquinone-9 3-methyltransferase (glyoxalase superfamily)
MEKTNKTIQSISTCLWFNNNAEEAVKFYTSIFKNSKTGKVAHYGQAGSEAAGMPKGSVMTIDFELDGQQFLALNGGPHFKFTHAISFVVNCHTQAEIDYYWEKLSKDGTAEQCGWLQDKFGVSWQIVPETLGEMATDPDENRADNVMRVMLKMKKIDIADLQKAYEEQFQTH